MQFKTKKDELAAFIVIDFLQEDVKKYLRQKFEKLGYSVTEEGDSLGLVFDLVLKDSGFSGKFLFHNFWLEVVTTDRDIEPLEFDTDLFDGQRMLQKAGELMLSKLELFKTIAKHKDKGWEEINKEIMKLSHLYERLDCTTVDKKKGGDINV